MTEVCSELTANVWKVLVAEGDAVAAGDVLMVLEAMKMEIPVEAPAAGVVQTLAVQEGGFVEEGGLLACLSAGT